MPVEAQNYTEILSDDDVLMLKVKKSVKKIIQSEGYVSSNVTVRIFEPDGENYLATLCSVDVEGLTDKGRKETNLFIKVIVPDEKMTYLSLKDAYKKELFCYNDFSKIVNEIQNEFGLPEEDKFTFVKNFYDVNNPEVVMLENMTKKGYSTVNRMDLITLEFAEMALKELAKFHALSFILEAWKPNFFNEEVKTIHQPLNFNEDYDTLLISLSQISIDNVDGEKKRILEQFVPKIFKKYKACLEGSTINGIKCCLCHGDYRPSNMLFKKIDGKISKVIPIDYQLVYYGCPVMDFLYFIIPNTDRKFRRTHLTYLKNIYYEAMRSYLKHFHLDVETIFPRKDFETIFKESLECGLFMSLILVPLLLCDEGGDLSDFADINKLKRYNNDAIKERIEDVVDDYIEWGYL